MKIDIIQPSGYCFGVMNAINEAIKIKKNNPFNNVYVLGELVHNEDVISFLNNHDIHPAFHLPTQRWAMFLFSM